MSDPLPRPDGRGAAALPVIAVAAAVNRGHAVVRELSSHPPANSGNMRPTAVLTLIPPMTEPESGPGFEPAPDPDADLVAAAQAELPYVTRAFEALLKRHQATVRKTCIGMIGDSDEAASVAQDIWIRVFNALPRFEGRAQFRTWLLSITYNACRSWHERTRQYAEKLDRYRHALPDDIEIDDAPLHEDRSDKFGRLLAGLGAEDRALLALRFIDDLELNEIAVVLGLRLSATKMRYYRALERIRKRIDVPADPPA